MALDNIFGVRLVRISEFTGAFPMELNTKVVKHEINERCFFRVLSRWQCNAYAFKTHREDVAPDIHKPGHLQGFGSENLCKADSGCSYCVWDDFCAIPKPGFHRELGTSLRILDPHMIFGLKDFEGDGESAVALRKFRAPYVDNLGAKYWVKCPPDCKILDFVDFFKF